MDKVLVILGSTSTGKTDLALDLAKKFNGELVSCDSRQVYVGLDIGTGKMPTLESKVKKGKGFWKINGLKIWMIDVVDPKKQYTVYDYVKKAETVINNILIKDKLPIVVGGTGLYLKALLEGLSNLGVPSNKNLRKQLEKLSLVKLQEKLQMTAFLKWEEMNESDQANPRRLIRAIEIAPRIGRLPRSPRRPRNDVLKIGLTSPREVLYKRIDERVISRINQGMVEEAKKLHNEGISLRRMRQLGLEYGVLADYLAGNIHKNDLIKIMQGKVQAFARRQITWFKKEKEVKWFDISDEKYTEALEKLVTKWYYSLDAA